MTRTYVSRSNDKRHIVKSQIFNIDNGAGTTIDECILRPARAVYVTGARVVYDTETTGTVAAATVGVGVTVGGVEVVAATALANTKAVGTTTALTIIKNGNMAGAYFVAAGTPVLVRHTGIAITAAGQYHVELEYIESK